MRPLRLSLLLAAALIVSCGDETCLPDSLGTVDAFVVTSDYATGGYALVDRARQAAPGSDFLHADAIARYTGGLVYVVNRLGGDNIQVIDPARGFATVRQFSVTAGSNPQDIAVASPQLAYVALYNADYILAFDPERGEEVGRIDLSELADADGFPETASVALAPDGALLATLQRLDRENGFAPTGDSYLVRIDVTADPPAITALPLAFPNPFGLMRVHPDDGTVLLTEAGVFGTTDGGLERIDTATLTSLEVVVTEEALGGDLVTAVEGGGRIYVVTGVAAAGGRSTDVVEIDRETGSRLETLFTPGSWAVLDLAIDAGGTLWVADRTLTAPALRLYGPEAGSPETVISLCPGILPPTQVVLF